MSQEKVDRYKKQKQERKNPKKKNKFVAKVKKIVPYVITGIVVLLIFGYLGISVAKQTGLYTAPTEPRSWSDQEIESLRQVLIQATDPNVQNNTTANVQQPIASEAVKENTKSNKTTKKSAKTEKTTKAKK